MGNLKSFMFGMAAAFGFYYLAKKGKDGTSIIDNILNNPHEFMHKAKYYAIEEVIRTAKEKIK